ncbi:MAG: MMPL family transporter [Nitrososphaerales archaeon]
MSGFEALGSFIRRRYRWIIMVWIVAVLISLTLIPSFFSSVNYNITGDFGGPSNTESQKAQNILNVEFPSSNGSQNNNAILIVVQGIHPFSDPVKNAVLALNQTLTADRKIVSYTGMSSVYGTEYSLLNSTLPELLLEAASIASNISISNPSVPYSQSWKLASSDVANASASVFADAPLFWVNATSLGLLLSSLSANSTTTQINGAITRVISDQSFSDYPLLPTEALTKNFVSQNNNTLLFILNLASYPSKETISHLSDIVQNSELKNFGTIYITGGPVITQDVQDVFTPALSVTLGPGIIVSILIVGVLFLSPLAALIPILMGGLSLTIAYSAIYIGVVRIGHGTLTFLTPTLTSLLMLGLAVDYAVLQLRRTREERLKGRSTKESVGISVKWAGQAVLTAGITVIVAYIVMAVANVPLFSDVGTSIAIGVSILLALSLTLLPSLEIALGDKMFWPGMRRSLSKIRSAQERKTRLEKIAEGTLKRKVAIAAAISVIALGAFFTSYNTPVGADFLKLIPNFASNQGLTVITDAFGGGLVGPVQLVVTTPTPIVYGDNQFNQTLLNEMEKISNIAGNSSGVVSAVGLTRPFGSTFDYSSLGNMTAQVRGQYEATMFSFIGKNNETALINIGLANSSQSALAINSLRGLEKNFQNLALPSGVNLYYGGATQETYDSESFLVGLLPQVVIILAAAVYVILFIQLRSAFTPVRLIFTILCSVAFSLAILSILFYHALSLPILDFAPLFVVVTMLGVGIDYDIFFVTRIREEVLSGKSDNEAIKTATDRVWVTILGLGLVLSSVFGSLVITGVALLQEIGLAVAAAIMVDVLVVILFFVPSLMGLAQRFNWWPSKIGKKSSQRGLAKRKNNDNS